MTTIDTPDLTTLELNKTPEPVLSTVHVPSSYANYPGASYLDIDGKTGKPALPTRFMDTKSYVGKSPIHGMGCFARANISAGEMIEESSAIILDTTVKSNKDWVITRYLFTWPCEHEDPICKEHGATYFVPTGNALIYNHSDAPNSYWIYDKAMKRLFLSALRDIKENEELTWYYGHGYAQKLRNMGNTDHKKGGCQSCGQKREDAKNNPNMNSNISKTLKDRLLDRSNAISGNSPISPPPEFRSMVVPEKSINDTIQEG